MEGWRDLEPEGEPIQFLAIVNTLLRRRWLIVGGTIATAILAAAYTLYLDPTYTASTKFVPTQGTSMAQLTGTAVFGGGSQDGPADNTTPEYYTALLTSRPFLEAILSREFAIAGAVDSGTSRESLLKHLAIEAESQQAELSMGVEKLGKLVTVSVGKTKAPSGNQIVTVSAIADQPALAADLANAFVDELVKYNSGARSNRAKENVKFVSGRLEEVRSRLSAAEEDLTQFTTRNRKIATPQLHSELDRLTRAVDLQEELFLTLSKQLEVARVQEQEQQVTIEVIEHATAPLMRTSPKRTQSVMTAAVLGALGFGALALLLEYLRKAGSSNEHSREFLDNLRGIKRELTLGLAGRK